ncbi:MAG: hypothetical protein ACXADY_19400 [Candidatus Hodarchaeales archaeon]|jgi:hypothetical protein
MVKLFKKSEGKQTTTFKFNSSLQLKNLKLEEYAHVIHAFHKGLTELNHLLRESLLENYISFQTFELISQELNLDEFRNCKIPNVPSIKTLFYSKAVELKTNEPEMISKIKQIESEKPPQEELQGPPRSEPKSRIPKITSSAPPVSSIQLGSSKPRRESDHASGIAILRKQMSEELMKIRSLLPDKPMKKEED